MTQTVATKEEVIAQLERILQHKQFAQAERLSQLLAYLVDNALNGQSDKLKGYTIGVEVYGKAVDFDPQTDNIVRVGIGRVRRKLAQFYVEEGANCTVVISIPTGSNIPLFTRQTIPVTAPCTNQSRQKPNAQQALSNQNTTDVVPPAHSQPIASNQSNNSFENPPLNKPNLRIKRLREAVLVIVVGCVLLQFALQQLFTQPENTHLENTQPKNTQPENNVDEMTKTLAATLHKVAQENTNQGHYQLALQNYQKAAMVAENNVEILLGLAAVHKQLGNYAQSLQQHQQALRVLAAQEREEAIALPKRVAALIEIADIHTQLKNFSACILVFKQVGALKAITAQDRFRILVGQSECHTQQESFAQSERNLLDAQQLLGLIGKDSGVAHRYYMARANYFAKKAELFEAVAELKTAEQLCVTSLKCDHLAKAIILRLSGNLYSQLGQHDQARKAYEQARQLILMRFSDKHIEYANLVSNEGTAAASKHEFVVAIDRYQTALSIYKEHLSNNSLPVAHLLHNLGLAYLHTADYATSLNYLVEAQTIYRTNSTKNPLAIAKVQVAIADCHQELGDIAKSLELYSAVLPTFKQVYGEHHARTAAVERENAAISNRLDKN